MHFSAVALYRRKNKQVVDFSLKNLCAFLRASALKYDLPIDEGVAFLGLLKEVHELALSVSQVELRILVTIAHRLPFVLGQPLVGIHDLETHLSKLLFVVFVIILF